MKRCTTIKRTPTVQSEVTYRAPKEGDLVFVFVGVCPPGENEGVYAERFLTENGWTAPVAEASNA